MPVKFNVGDYLVHVTGRPARRLILKRGVKAVHYFEYTAEIGFDPTAALAKIPGALGEPCGMWLPSNLRKPGTSEFVMGVEMPASFIGPVPEGYEVIRLKPCKMMVFQGPRYGGGEYPLAVMALWQALEDFKPELYGFVWADEDAPRLQLPPDPSRGHIEMLPVRPLNVSK